MHSSMVCLFGIVKTYQLIEATQMYLIFCDEVVNGSFPPNSIHFTSTFCPRHPTDRKSVV